MSNSLDYLQRDPSYQQVTFLEKIRFSVEEVLNNYTKELLVTGAALTVIGSVAIKLGVTAALLPAASIPLLCTGVVVTAIGAGILLGVAIHWRHVLAYFVAVPVLALFGVQWSSKIDPYRIPVSCCHLNGRILAGIYHENNKPILQFHTEDNYEMGFAQGYLLGEQIQEAFDKVLKPMMGMCRLLTGDFSGEFYNRQVKEINIPDPYLREIKGIVAGVQLWAKQRGIESTITEETAINAHKLTDIYKAIGCQRLFGITGFNSFGCSTTIVKKGKEQAVGRTLDWPSLGKMGEFCFVRRHVANGKNVEMQTFAGIVGALTAHNNDGLVAIINENSTVSRAGTPYAMLAREVIETCASVDQAEIMINFKDYVPASSHHLTLADGKRGAVFQMVLDKDKKYIKKELNTNEENSFIVVTNHSVYENNTAPLWTVCDDTSMRRYRDMTASLNAELLTDRSIDEVVNRALLSVNVLDTVATAQFRFTPNDRKKVQVVKYTNNNYWAARPLAKRKTHRGFDLGLIFNPLRSKTVRAYFN